MHNLTISQISQGLEKGDFTSVEITQHFLDRIKQLDQNDGGFNSFITVTEEQALADARSADERRAAGNATPWTGVPFAHKDIFCTDGTLTTCGSKMLSNFIPPYDATVVDNFKQQGAVCLGKTNMDEFAMGSSNESSFFGAVKNPWNKETIPGGSSGGSAAAVAARLTPAATGTDTGGSIRQPAALCGLTGLKPTYGRCSRFGMIAFASSLDQAGPMTQTAEDAAMMLNVMASFDEKDSTSINQDVPDYTATLNNDIAGKVIGIPKEFFPESLDGEMADAVKAAIAQFEKLGCAVKEISLPSTDLAIPAYYVVAPAECSANLSRMDGVRFGHRCEDPKDVEDLYKRSRGEGFGDVPPITPQGAPIAESAARYLCETCAAHPGEIIICAIGPLTNIALALDYDPTITTKVKAVYIMGGGLNQGNVTKFAEANIWNDPHAANAVLAAEWDVTMVGLDITTRVQCVPADFAELAISTPEIGNFLDEAVQFYMDFYAVHYGKRGCDMHDPTAIIAITDPQYFTIENHALEVILDGARVGQTIRSTDLSRPKHKVPMNVDAQSVKQRFLSMIKTGF